MSIKNIFSAHCLVIGVAMLALCVGCQTQSKQAIRSEHIQSNGFVQECPVGNKAIYVVNIYTDGKRTSIVAGDFLYKLAPNAPEEVVAKILASACSNSTDYKRDELSLAKHKTVAQPDEKSN